MGTKHGHAQRGSVSRTYKIWSRLHDRVNPNHSNYKDYGAKGIGVCDRWLNSFIDFLADMGECPSPIHSLDRIDGSKGYEPGNVRWVTPTEQNRNKRTNVVLTHPHTGERKCIAEWSERIGIGTGTLYSRVKAGWSDAETLLTPVYGKRG